MWNGSLASIALNGEQHFAFVYSFFTLSLASWRPHFSPALRKAAIPEIDPFVREACMILMSVLNLSSAV